MFILLPLPRFPLDLHYLKLDSFYILLILLIDSSEVNQLPHRRGISHFDTDLDPGSAAV